MESTRDLKRRDFLKAGMVASAFMIVPRHVLGGKGFEAPSDKITMGLIGCGKQGGGLARLFQENGAQLVGAADVFREKREATAKRINKEYAEIAGKTAYESCRTYEDFRELLDRKDIDAVIIALPDHWHAAAAVRAARAGKDIYCEKPLSLTVQEGRAMVDATRQHNRGSRRATCSARGPSSGRRPNCCEAEPSEKSNGCSSASEGLPSLGI